MYKIAKLEFTIIIKETLTLACVSSFTDPTDSLSDIGCRKKMKTNLITIIILIS